MEVQKFGETKISSAEAGRGRLNAVFGVPFGGGEQVN